MYVPSPFEYNAVFKPFDAVETMDMPTDYEVFKKTSSQSHQSLSYKLVGDNVDKNIKARYIRMDVYSNQSLHCFHSFAVMNRVDFSHLFPVSFHSSQEIVKSLLPSASHDTVLYSHIITIISRILYTNMSFFKVSFDGCVQWHIKHKFYQQMSTKSIVVSS